MENSIARCLVLLVASFGMAGILPGCAVPVIPAENIVRDADILDCSAEMLGDLGPLDVAVAIDTSLSTMAPTGVDIDGDGSIGVIELSSYTDRGDSHLSAQVTALRSLLRNSAKYDIRFSIITFSGSNVIVPTNERTSGVVSDRNARIRARLSDDFAALESVLDEVLEDGSGGSTDFYAGMRRANRSLIESDDPERDSRKIVLFMSDSPGPTGRELDATVQNLDARMARAARQALRHQIIFNTFGVSADSGMWRRRSLGQIAGATSGTYHVVANAQQLYCHLASSLALAAKGTPIEPSEEP